MDTAGGQKFVLVVEDDFAMRRALAEMLAGAGYRVRTAGTGREALLELSLEPVRPCLVVLDLAMPEMGGEQFIEQLQLQGVLDQIRIVAITATSPRPDLPVSAVFKKPVSGSDLLAAVANACR